MLDTVINNLELVPDYYQRASLPFVLYEGNKLLDLYDKQLAVRKVAAQKEDDPDTVTADQAAAEAFTDEEPEEARQCKRIKLSTPEKEPADTELVVTPCA